MKNEIMVSICCITYNQEMYIRDAIEGFLKQKTNFKYEVIIHDDASTDNTAQIIKEYENKYPDIIKPIYQRENQYSKGISPSILTYKNAIGKYIAICEGDDYWTNEHKLQKQVDYMEANPLCTFCFHNANVIDMNKNSVKKLIPYKFEDKKYVKKDGIYNVGELELLEFIPTASFMFRNENISKLPKWFETCYVKDWPLKLLMTSFGYAYCINEIMSVYRKGTKNSMIKRMYNTENQNLENKLRALNQKEEIINNINEFTDYKYNDIFEKRKREYEIDRLIITRKTKDIIKKKYLKGISFINKIKYILKMYFPFFTKKIKRY